MLDPLPPYDRQMTADEKRGFNMACNAFRLWGAQIARAGVTLGGDREPIPRDQVMQHSGRMVASCAEALQLTIGK